ncbi:hypothetical protein A3849_00075 [Paenibacillus sp. P46E]|nr:hypothetical protein A3849_00075 [Paenibacillus sp. P46E]
MYAIARSGTEEGGDFSALFLLEIEVLENKKPPLGRTAKSFPLMQSICPQKYMLNLRQYNFILYSRKVRSDI